jgi:ABC-2 type transport system ATP-binding protein
MKAAIEVRDLKKSYATSSRFWQRRELYQALDGINLKVERGEIVGLVGRNGYGKTTLIKCIAGLLAPSAGVVNVWEYDGQKQASAVRRLIGWVGAEERSFYLRLTG